ncbi:MAG: adenosylcobinamide-GDP ribazoletransferase [Treponema sp.]|jgi:adenosylcobinamide-GDP ribazoletransferase|nr:adenosylcobinamide-GDP ribazoletransferase [Treponema sp.]
MKTADRFLSTFSLISRIPVKAKFNFDPSGMDFFLPVTGVVPALLVFIACVILSFAGNLLVRYPLIAAVLIIIVQYFCFNLFHLDGLMDTADAFLGTVRREKRQEILKDSRVGVYGFFAGFISLVLKAALLSGLCPVIPAFPAVILAYPVTGRFAAALLPCMAEPANPGGLGALLKDSRPRRCVLGFAAAAAVWVLIAWGLLNAAALMPVPGSGFSVNILGAALVPAALLAGLSALVIAPGTAFFYARLYRRGIGGYTGDALGAAVETAELLYLAAALAAISA